MADSVVVCDCSTAVERELSRATTAAKVEIDWNCVMINENAPTSSEKAMADWVITPNSMSPSMKPGATIKAKIIWISQL